MRRVLSRRAVATAAFVRIKDFRAGQPFQFAPEEPPPQLIAFRVFYEFFKSEAQLVQPNPARMTAKAKDRLKLLEGGVGMFFDVGMECLLVELPHGADNAKYAVTNRWCCR